MYSFAAHWQLTCSFGTFGSGIWVETTWLGSLANWMQVAGTFSTAAMHAAMHK